MTLTKLWILWMDNYRAGQECVRVEREINAMRNNK